MTFRNKKLIVLAIVAAAILIFFISRGNENSPQGVAEQFLFHYFIELNQSRALQLSTDLAAEKLKKEMKLVQGVRMEPDLDLSSQKPFIDYKLVNIQERPGHSFMLYYDVFIESKGGGKYQRQMVLSTLEVDGIWKVNNYDTFISDQR